MLGRAAPPKLWHAACYAFEEFADECNVKLKRFHADNHPFNSREFHRDLELQDQTVTFSAVGAHHQNGVAERNIQTIMSWALSM